MTRKAKWLIIILCVLLALELAAALAVVGYWNPYRRAVSNMPDSGTMILTCNEDGQLRLAWPEGKYQDRYLVEITDEDGQLLWQTWTHDPDCLLPSLPENTNLDIRVNTGKGYKFLFGKERIRMGRTPLQATAQLQMPKITDLNCSPDPENLLLRFDFTLEPDSMCRMYRVTNSGELAPVTTLDEGKAVIMLGPEGLFPVPEAGEELKFAFDVYRYSPGMVYYGTVSARYNIEREDLLLRDLNLQMEDLGNLVYRFNWAETKGQYYELQQYDALSGTWKPLHQVLDGQDRSYTTGHLERRTEYRFRVVAVGGQTMPDSVFAAVSEEITVTTENTAVYCTVWPIQKLDIYDSPEKTNKLGTASAAKAYCVLDEANGMFRIRHGDLEGYIDSNYCMINLPEYLGDLCRYDITNSYSSRLTAHEYELPKVTGTVIPGYERVQLRRGQMLVPLLYPTACKLEKAALKAAEKGYRLKIYDAYRPQTATKALYDRAGSIMNEQLPLITWYGTEMEDLPELLPGQQRIYGDLITDFGKYDLADFFASGKSRYNRGLALDVTLVEIANGGEVMMQTSIHDMSAYSVTSRNTKGAKTLASIMESAGFTGVKTQWWHFYDAATQTKFKPEYQSAGVTPEGWMADDRGWRYRRDDGEYLSGCTQTIDGVSYTFDRDGYLVNN